MAFNLINPSPRLGDFFQIIASDGPGLPLINNSGATVSRGQCAALDMTYTGNGFATVISTGANASSGKYPIVIALADVASGVQSTKWAVRGQLPAIATTGLAKGRLLQPGTVNATGGNILIAANTANTGIGLVSCARWASNSTSDGTTPDTVIFDGCGGGRGINASNVGGVD